MKTKRLWPVKILSLFAFFSLLLLGTPGNFYALSLVEIEPGFFTRSVSDISFGGDEKKIFVLVNREREKKGLNRLIWNESLARLARAFSEKMARDDFFDHIESDGADVVKRAKALRIKKWEKIGENLFVCSGYDNYAAFAVQNWMKSKTHRQNILDKDFTATGIGLAAGSDEKIYMTQVFIED